MIMIKARRVIGWAVFPGPCPLVTCLLASRHRHGVCLQCGSQRFTNRSCESCRRVLSLVPDAGQGIKEIGAWRATP